LKPTNKLKQRHLYLSQQLRNNSIDYVTLEAYRQELHYIEVEYDYRPRYSDNDLRPRCKHSNKPTHTRPKHTRTR